VVIAAGSGGGGQCLLTPPPWYPILRGTIQQALFEVARAKGYGCDHRALRVADLRAAQRDLVDLQHDGVSTITSRARTTGHQHPLPGDSCDGVTGSSILIP
jgi:branched-subunit amino acid aminotransferase/4-amino-4-deoxychorismate lyase